MMDYFTTQRLAQIRQEEMLKQLTITTEKRRAGFWAALRASRPTFGRVKLPSIPAPNRRRVSRT